MIGAQRTLAFAGAAALIALSACEKGASAGRAADAVVDSATAIMTKGDTLGALDVFTRAIALDSSSARAYRGRGVAQRAIKHYDLAIADYSKAIVLDSTSAGTYNNRGFVYQLMGDYEHSLKDFDRAIALNPQSTQAYRSRARSHFYLGHFQEAASDFRAGPSAPATNAYVPLWAFIADRRVGGGDTAQLARQLKPVDLKPWPGPVANLYLGRISEKEFLAATANADPVVQKEQECAAAFYLGEYLLWQKPAKIPEAKARLNDAIAESCTQKLSEYLGAKADLSRLP